MVDSGAENSILVKLEEPLSVKQTKVEGATKTKPNSLNTQRTVDLGMGWVTHSLLVIPKCFYLLIGRDLITKMKAQINFLDKRVKLLHPDGKPVQILVTSDLTKEYRLHQKPMEPGPTVENWLHNFPLAWAETGRMVLALHRPQYQYPNQDKTGADPVKVCQYPMSLRQEEGLLPT